MITMSVYQFSVGVSIGIQNIIGRYTNLTNTDCSIQMTILQSNMLWFTPIIQLETFVIVKKRKDRKENR